MLYSGGVNGSIHLWRMPPSSLNRQAIDPYRPVDDSQCQVATWEQAHENQPIWSLKLNSQGQLLSVGSDASVALWQSPSGHDLQTKS